MMEKFQDATIEEVHEAMEQSWNAFRIYRKKSRKQRADLMRSIAAALQINETDLINTAESETHLEKSRLKLELKRTIFQLTSYAEACEEGHCFDYRIDTPDNNGQTPGKDLRKMLVPLGPVVVFGASNFPFAYSTAGGDTASALAAGCSVVVKAHPAHAQTSELVARLIKNALTTSGLPQEVFIHLHGASFSIGESLVKNKWTKAVAFTGTFAGGKALFDLANQRTIPIPVFAEMGSVNPVFILPQKLKKEVESIAALLADSITQSVGQFCTNPGIIVTLDTEDSRLFISKLGDAIKQVRPQQMLHEGISTSFKARKNAALGQEGVTLIAENPGNDPLSGTPTISQVHAREFITNPLLHQEVFGPYSLVVLCQNKEEMLGVAQSLEGQLTATIMGNEDEIASHEELVETLLDRCGRFIINGVPTGVQVAWAMHHGGPFPATTDSRFTAVGGDAIRRFGRPVCFQGWEDALLPAELQNGNPLSVWRLVNNEWTRAGI